MKKLLSFLLALVLMLGLAMPVSAAKAKAVTMRVQLVEGSVTIKDASGVTLSYFEGMQLYSGYSVITGDDSCAYISLDDSKAIKLDMNTSVSIKKSGRKLQVNLLAGQIVFNVTTPLAGNESLEIRTSTMVTGVRGSSGVVTLRKVIYVTGHGTVYQFDEFGALPKGFEIWGGQLLELKDDGSEAKIENAQVSDIPSVYLKEVEQNEQLQESLESEGNYSADELIAEVPAAEKREEEKREAAKESSAPLPGSGGSGNTDGGDTNTDPAFQKKSEDDTQETAPLIPSYPVVPYDMNPVEEPVYTISWIVEGSQPVTTSVKRGQVPEYPGEAPVREEDAEFTYTFDHWEPHPIAAKEDTTYTAVFTETRKTYPVRFIDEDGTELQSSILPYGETPVYSGETPTKPATAQYTYTFDGWTPDLAEVTGAAEYKAIYVGTVREYTITFVNYDGTELQSSNVAYGETPVYAGETPTKPADEQYTYTFAGWDPAIAAVSGEATYTAQFTSTPIEQPETFTIAFVSEDGKKYLKDPTQYTLGTSGDEIEQPDNVAKDPDTQNTYTFVGWKDGTQTYAPNELPDVSASVTYTAVFQSSPREYTITFVNYDGTELQSSDVAYGETPVYADETPTKAGSAQYTYTFAGWTPAIAAVSGEATYTATFNETVNKYTVTFVFYDGADLTETSADYDYGTSSDDINLPDLPERTPDAQFSYEFFGWDKVISDVTANVTYTASYTSTVNNYTITWMDDDGSTIDTTSVPYGTVPTHADPTKADDEQYTYAFSGWDPTLETVTADATYTAQYTATRLYTLTVAVPDGVASITVNGNAYTADATVKAAEGAQIPVACSIADGYTGGPATTLTAGTTVLAQVGTAATATLTVTGDAVITVNSPYRLLDDSFFASDPVEITVPSAIDEEIVAVLDVAQNADLYITDSGKLIICAEMTVAERRTLSNEGTLTVGESGILNNYGTITNETSIIVEEDGTFNNYSAHTVYNNGTLINRGYFSNGNDVDPGRIVNGENAYLINEMTFVIHADSTIENAGTLFCRNGSTDAVFDSDDSPNWLSGSGAKYDRGGFCGADGANLIWYFTEAGVDNYELHIVGSGAMQDFDYTNGDMPTIYTPWAAYVEMITALDLDDRITSIGTGAFAYTPIESVALPDGVTSIGRYAFLDCMNLTGVDIPSSVKTIGLASFMMSGLTTIVIPDGVETIGEYAFQDCTSLTSVTISDSVTTISEGAFYTCDYLATVVIGDGVTNIGDYAFYQCRELTDLTIGSSVQTIGTYAFQRIGIATLMLPDSLTSIGDLAFDHCANLVTTVFLGGPPTFGNGVFDNTADGFLIIYPTGDARTKWRDNTNYDTGAQTYYGYNAQSGVLVSYEMNLTGLELDPQRVEYGACATAPATPVDPDDLNVFYGWYSDDLCTIPFDFESTPITENTTLYAKWTYIGAV